MGNKYTIVLNKHYTITDLLLDKKSVVDNKRYECPICMDLLYNKQVYQCREGHLSCKECWTESIKASSKCSTCRMTVLSLEELSRNRFVEEEFSELQCLCPYLFSNILDTSSERVLECDDINGCKKIMKAGELDDHIKKCEFRFISCTNKDCQLAIRANKLNSHLNDCDYTLIDCENCSTKHTRGSIEKHYSECQSYPLSCEHCSALLRRGDYMNHITNECQKIMVSCKYNNHGCTGQFKRCEEDDHLTTVNHTIYMSRYIMDLEKKVLESNQKYDHILNNLTTLAEQIRHNNKLLSKDENKSN